MPVNFEEDFIGTWRAAFSGIVKPEMRVSWENRSKEFFVLDQSVTSKRKPGSVF